MLPVLVVLGTEDPFPADSTVCRQGHSTSWIDPMVTGELSTICLNTVNMCAQ